VIFARREDARRGGRSLAGRRAVSIPAALLPDILSHLEDFTALGEDALVFTGPKNAQLRRSNFSRAWRDATTTANLTGFHFHDLRHTGNTLAGAAGASLQEMMERMGHGTTSAALIYQHRTSERDKLIADAMGKPAKAELRQRKSHRARSGTERQGSILTPTAETTDYGSGLGFHCGAGDENRTRTISLGSGAVTAARGADQPG
jgi:hypothetical protein